MSQLNLFRNEESEKSPFYRGGGFPCQPHSVAGKRKASADERDLWGEFARVICEIKPRWVLGENVPGLLSSEDGRFFGRVLNDLAKMGYNVGWCCYGAKDVGAVHKRERIFIVAHANSIGRLEYKGFKKTLQQTEYQRLQREENKQPVMSKPFHSTSDVTDTNSFNVERCSSEKIQGVTGLQGKLHTGSIEEWQRRCEIYQPKLCRTYNGIPGQVDRLKCLGNAVVPQQVYPILKAIAEIERGG